MRFEGGQLDPAVLAENAALQVVHGPEVMKRNIPDSERLSRLDAAATDLGLTGRTYWVEANRGLSIPVEFDPDKVRLIDFFGINFEGRFRCYSKLIVGKILGRESVSRVSALCLTFDEATLLPDTQGLPEDHLFYVPVLAVNAMDKTA
jgi:hypothetical protein